MANDSPDWTGPGGGTAPDALIDTITVTAGNSKSDDNIAVPVGTQSIGFIVASVNANPSQIVITGDQSSSQYCNALVFNHLGPQWFPYTSKDITALLQVTAPAGNGCTVYFFASPLIKNYANDNSIGGGAGQWLWQAATNRADVAVALANMGTATIVAAVAGESVYMFGVSFCFDAASIGNDLQVRDGVGGPSKSRFSAVSTTPPAQQWDGAKMTQGNGVQIFANGAALTPRGGASYSQGAP